MAKGKSGGSSKGVPAARLHQKATGKPVNGVAKVNHGNGTFSMKKSGK